MSNNDDSKNSNTLVVIVIVKRQVEINTYHVIEERRTLDICRLRVPGIELASGGR